jgi:DnaA-homolog protein
MFESKQLILDMRLDDHNTFDNFWIGDNRELVDYLRTFSSAPTSPTEQFVYLWGSRYSGRSHLLHACCSEANHQERSCFYLSLQNINKLNPQILENLETTSLVCLDDIQSIINLPEWEEAIFKLFNGLWENKKQLIVAANIAPLLLPITLPDLKSRLASGLSLPIIPLTDEQKLAALQMRAKKRGLHFPESVGKYLLNRYARDTKNLFAVLDKLDKASLISQHKLTVPFIKTVLKNGY